MPQFIIPVILAATSATELGMNLAGVGRPSTPDPNKQLDAAKQAQAQADADTKMKAIRANLANAQEQGGGALNAPSLTDLAAVIAGLPGESGTTAGRTALSSFLGTPSPTASTDTMMSATYGPGLSGSQG